MTTPARKTTKDLTKPAGYKKLLASVSREFTDLEDILKQRTVEGMWRIGKYLDEHILEHKDRADYGKKVIKKLAGDVNRDPSLLARALKFYRAYPILATSPKLSWEHYRDLITIQDEKKRKKIEQKAIKENWSSWKLRSYINNNRASTTGNEKSLDPARGKPVPQLTFIRGRLNIYQIIESNKSLIRRSPLALDLGFREQHPLSVTAKAVKGDMVELLYKEGRPAGVNKVEVAKEEIFTYPAYVDEVTDGDTLLVSFDFHLDVSISQKLRLRGIDCPEVDTVEGKRAKRFVESRLKDCEFIIVKTYKDRTDKFDRYLADVFYLPKINKNNEEGVEHAPRSPKGGAGVTTILEDVSDPAVVAREGIYLNQELLDNHLAVIWKSGESREEKIEKGYPHEQTT